MHPSIYIFFIVLFVTSSCGSGSGGESVAIEDDILSQIDKSNHQLAEEFLNALRIEKADTIIFYKRTCVGCCDFFNVFWSAKGKRYLTKFDSDNIKTHYKTIALTDDKVFEEMGENFLELKNTSIKQNSHELNDGSCILQVIDHDCYSQLRIYIDQDSLVTDGMRDHDFDKYFDFETNSSENSEKRKTNDNYSHNTSSKWNMLLTTIESEISSMTETTKQELETLRTR